MSSASKDVDEQLANIESYDTEDGTVLYDSQNPLAWIKTDTILTLKEQQ